MTTNQTIDGVPRADLAEIYAQMVDYWERIDGEWGSCGMTVDEAMDKGDLPALAKLRALLDREVITDDHLRQRIAFLTSEVHARANERDAALSELAELKATQPQGEPVAFTAVGVLRDDGDGGLVPDWILEGGTAELWAGAVLLIADEDQELCAEDGHCELYRAPAEQLAPVAVVLPERVVLRDIIAQAIGGDAYDCTRGWSAWGVGTMSDDDFIPITDQEERLYEIADACLDEVTRLNTKSR